MARKRSRNRKKNVYKNRGYDPTRRRRIFMNAAYVVAILMAVSMVLASYTGKVSNSLPKTKTTQQAAAPIPSLPGAPLSAPTKH